MIIQNGQPRNYAICNGRNVAMLRGGQWIIEPVVLSYAVKSQIYADILDASLANEVWRAANLYCKSHAASHPELTAQGKLLSAFVNNDPDMYASLPLTATPAALSAMPTRRLCNSGTQYINTGYIPSIGTKAELTAEYIQLTGNVMGCTSGTSMSYFSPFVVSGGKWVYYFNSYHIDSTSLSVGTKYDSSIEVQSNQAIVKLGSTTRNQRGSNFTSSKPIGLFAGIYNSGAGDFSKSKIYKAIIYQDGVLQRYFIPCHTTSDGMLDLQTLTFYANAGTGSFTIEKS